jgi:hypothetical protein
MSEALAHRIRSGSIAGLAIGVAFAVVAVPVLLVRGSSFLERTGTRLELVIAVYLIGGPMSGALAMAMVPLTRHFVGAIVVGMIAIAPLYLGGRVAVRGLQPWDTSDTAVVTACCVLVGGLTGGLVHHGLRAADRRGEDSRPAL